MTISSGTCCGQKLYITFRHTSICMECGIEKRIPFDMFNSRKVYTSNAPLFTGYSRKNRFEKMLDAVLTPISQPGDNVVLYYLNNHTPIKDMKELMSLLKNSPSKDKRYGSLHLYSKLFISSYEPPMVPTNLESIKKSILSDFGDVEFYHRKLNDEKTPFFNYCWLLIKFLKKYNLIQYLRFVKPLKCKHRRELYKKMYDKLGIKV